MNVIELLVNIENLDRDQVKSGYENHIKHLTGDQIFILEDKLDKLLRLVRIRQEYLRMEAAFIESLKE